MIEIITPKDRKAWLAARSQDVTASVIGALFGVHEYATAYQLWGVKTGRLPTDNIETPAMMRGRLLEPVAVQILRERFPKWEIEHSGSANTYYRDPNVRIGATPDAIVRAPIRGLGVVQIKSVEASAYRRKWLTPDGIPEAPTWIALQAAVEAHLTGASWAAVAPLVIGHGIDLELIEVDIPPGLIDAIIVRVREFWEMIANGSEPSPDFANDLATIDAIFPNNDPNHEIDLTGDNRIPALLDSRADALARRAAAIADLDAIDAEVKAKIKNATVAHIGEGRRIQWSTQRRPGFSVAPSTIRSLKYPKAKTGGRS